MPRGIPASGQRARRRTKAEMAAARQQQSSPAIIHQVNRPSEISFELQKPDNNGFVIQKNAVSDLINNRYQIFKGIDGYTIYDYKLMAWDKVMGDLLRDKSKEILRFPSIEKAIKYVS